MQSFPPVWQDEAHAPAVSAALLVPEPATFAINNEWGSLVRKGLHGVLFVAVVKLLAVWTMAALASVSMNSRLIWGFIPYASLDATASEYRSIASWSTAAACLAAVLWVSFHVARQRRYSFAQVAGALGALIVAGLLLISGWGRSVEGERLISGGWLLPLSLIVLVTAVASARRIDGPTQRAQHNAERVGLPLTPLQIPPH